MTRRELLKTVGGGALTISLLSPQATISQPGPCKNPAGYAQCFYRWFLFFARFAGTPAALIAIVLGVGLACYELYCI